MDLDSSIEILGTTDTAPTDPIPFQDDLTRSAQLQSEPNHGHDNDHETESTRGKSPSTLTENNRNSPVSQNDELEVESSVIPSTLGPLSNTLKAMKGSYYVYLLNLTKKTSRFYIGSTPNPPRRLLQHNGVLKMGAKKTSSEKLRPWQMVCLIHGFNLNIAALQFETAFQKPHLSHHLLSQEKMQARVARSGPKTARVHLAVLRLLIRSSYFSRMVLTVDILQDDVYDLWLENKYQVHLKAGSEGAIVRRRFEDPIACFEWNNLQYEGRTVQRKKFLEELNLVCQICEEPVFENTVFCEQSGMAHHMICLAQDFLKQEGEDVTPVPLLPVKGRCRCCSKMRMWCNLIR